VRSCKTFSFAKSPRVENVNSLVTSFFRPASLRSAGARKNDYSLVHFRTRSDSRSLESVLQNLFMGSESSSLG
jgi:hypothetical protein